MSPDLSRLGEFGLIELFRQGRTPRPWVDLGVGDDCAVLRLADACLLVTSDLLVEGVHFNRSTTSPEQLGHKALAVSLSDVAAMGGEAQAVFLSVAWTPDLDEDFVRSFRDGFEALAARHGVDLLGGDTVAGRGDLSVCTTVIGRAAPDRVVRRAGASAGDLVFVGRAVGDSAAGLALLQADRDRGPYQALLDAHLVPDPQLELGRLLAEHRLARAMIDVSDGLLQDLGHLCAAGGLGAEIESERIPVSAAARRLGEALDRDPLDWALRGGEDFCLLFAVAEDRREELAATIGRAGLAPVIEIGRLVERPGLRLGRAGGFQEVSAGGWDHFKPRTLASAEDDTP